MAMGSTKVISSRTVTRGIRKGRVAVAQRSKGTFATRDNTYRTIPTGGVRRPIIRFRTMITPKWIGSTPRATTVGSNTGVRMVMAARVSIKKPTTKRMMLISISTTYLFWEKASRAVAKFSVTLLAVRIQVKMDAFVIIRRIIAVDSMVSILTAMNFFTVMVR